MGLLILLRSEILPLVGMAAAVVLWGTPTRRTMIMLALYVAVVAATMGPWVWRNYTVSNRFIAVSAHEGDTLWVTTRPGNRWEKEGRRGGKLMFSESVTEYRNQDGVLCVTATSVGVQTEKAVDQ